MNKILLISILFIIQGCQTVEPILQKNETFIVCKSADIITTNIALRSGKFVEANKFVLSTLNYGYIPIIFLSVGIYKWMEYEDNKQFTEVINGITCVAAGTNILKILR